jgi:hypothetical protein
MIALHTKFDLFGVTILPGKSISDFKGGFQIFGFPSFLP